MRLLIGGVVALGVAVLSVPLLAAGTSSRTGGRPDAGANGDSEATASASPPPKRKPIQRTEVRSRHGRHSVVYVGDKIGTLTNGAVATDGGTAPETSAKGASVAELRQQVAALQARTDELERKQSAAQDQLQLLQQMNEQLRALNAQMGQTQADKSDQSSQEAARQQQVQQAISGLGPALDSLASGDGQVGDALDAAEQAFPPQARRDLEAARYAITTSNLGEARAYLQAAIGDAQAGR